MEVRKSNRVPSNFFTIFFFGPVGMLAGGEKNAASRRRISLLFSDFNGIWFRVRSALRGSSLWHVYCNSVLDGVWGNCHGCITLCDTGVTDVGLYFKTKKFVEGGFDPFLFLLRLGRLGCGRVGGIRRFSAAYIVTKRRVQSFNRMFLALASL